LPCLWIEQKNGFKNFAKKMLLPLMPENEKEFTIVSTLFVLSDLFDIHFSFEKNIIQYGVTEKLIYIYCAMQDSNPCVIWPSALSPYQLFVDNQIANRFDGLKNNLRYKTFSCNASLAQRIVEGQYIAELRDAPVVIFTYNNQLYYRLQFTLEIGKLERLEDMLWLLSKSDCAIFSSNKARFDSCLANQSIKCLCVKCQGNLIDQTSLGILYPAKRSKCIVCGCENFCTNLMLQANIRSSINEKLTANGGS
jgi:hypothetical protein